MEAVAWKRPKVSKAVDRRVVVNPGQARELLTAVTYVGGTSVLAVVAFALSSPVCTTRAFVPARHPVYGVCCIERSQVIFAGRFAVVTAAGAPAPVRCGLVSTGWWHSEGLLAVRFPVKITSDHSMQQTPMQRVDRCDWCLVA
jgi:hypothetical protein